jgi:hypothetical protein
VEGRARDGGDSHFAGEPAGEVHVAHVADPLVAGQDVVGALWGGEGEAGRAERIAQDLAAGAIVEGEVVVVIGVERHPDGGRLLQRRGRADGEEVVHLADGDRLARGGDGVAQAPSGATEGLGESGDRDRALGHARPGGEHMVRARIADVLVDLVGDGPDVVPDAELGDEVEFLAGEDAPGRGCAGC